MKSTVLLLIFLAGTLPAHAQGTRWLLDAQEGGSSFTTTIPSLSFGAGFERPLGSRVEAQGGVAWSPDNKAGVGGDSIVLTGALLTWLNTRIAVIGKVDRSYLWTRAYNKSAWYPKAGVVIRDSWYGSPGRLELTYLFPTGCQWQANCTIQGARLQGLEVYQEFRLWRHWRFGLKVGTFHGLEQGNPLQPSAGRKGYIGGFTYGVFRYEFGGDAETY